MPDQSRHHHSKGNEEHEPLKGNEMTENKSEAAALAGATASETQMSAVVGTAHATSATAAPATPVVPRGGTFQDAVVYALDALDRRLRAVEQRQVLVLLRQDELRDLVVEQLHLLRIDGVDPAARADILELQRAVEWLVPWAEQLNVAVGELSEGLGAVQ